MDTESLPPDSCHTSLPPRSRLGRWALYFKQMYPPLPSLLISLLSFFNLYFLLAVLRGEALIVDRAGVAGALTIFCFLLFLRISDELKDADTDRQLFPHRLVPSGQVLLSDLKILMVLTIIVMWGLNLFLTGAPLAFAALFGYGLLMLNYFFLRPLIARSLLLALLTHNPSILLMNGYIMAVYAANHSPFHWRTEYITLLLIFWLPGLAWELARKIRAPQDENEYETYSRIFGYRWATLFTMWVLSLHYLLLMTLIPRAAFSGWFVLAMTLAVGAVLSCLLRFMLRPSTQSAHLKPYVEGYMLIQAFALLLDLVLRREVTWQLL